MPRLFFALPVNKPVNTATQPFETGVPTFLSFKPLYNGNIAGTSMFIPQLGPNIYYATYNYDQLNRLKHTVNFTATGAGWTGFGYTDNNQENFTYDGNGNILTTYRDGNTDNGKPLNMDNLVYNYNKDANGKLLNNKLNYINDWATPNAGYVGDMRMQAANNYTYDAIGNMTADAQAGVSNINWSVYGKILSQTSSASGTITYTYDPAGQRATKTVNGITTYYVRDAQGNTLAVYDNKLNQTNWREQHLYGSSRLGMWTPNVNLANNNAATVWDTVGHKQYELNNHLGNVMATITDKRIAHSSDGGTTIDYYQPDITTAQQYYAFGSQMPGLTYTASNNYRYGFNGKENDNEVKGVGNEQDYGNRIYDTRIGRWFSADKIGKPSFSSYQFGKNSPTNYVDPDGNDEIHFYYYTRQNLDKNGKAYTSITVWSQIIQNGRQDHTFFVHPEFGKAVQIHPFEKGTNLPNQSSFSASRNELAMAGVTKYLFGMAQVHTDDYEYLGKLLLADPSVTKYYANNAAWSRAFSGAELQVSSANFGRKVLNTSETVYGIIDGYSLVRGGVSAIIRATVRSPVELYSLRAAGDGFYPIMKRGFLKPQGSIFLNEGDVWKYGTTKNPLTRYSQNYLFNTGEKGLFYKTESAGSLEQSLQGEKFNILDYKDKNGILPPGNKIVK